MTLPIEGVKFNYLSHIMATPNPNQAFSMLFLSKYILVYIVVIAVVIGRHRSLVMGWGSRGSMPWHDVEHRLLCDIITIELLANHIL